jgi:hypothetical protein
MTLTKSLQQVTPRGCKYKLFLVLASWPLTSAPDLFIAAEMTVTNFKIKNDGCKCSVFQTGRRIRRRAGGAAVPSILSYGGVAAALETPPEGFS